MARQTITAVIPAKNEEENIERCIRSLDWCDKVIVMWMGSDKTGQLARKLGAEVVEKNKSEKNDFIAVQKNINWAIDHCGTDWVLRIDADEEVTAGLKKEILDILANRDSEIAAYGVPRNQFFWGGFLKGGDWAYDRLVRLFRADAAKYDPIVSIHEQFTVKGAQGLLDNALNHYSHPTLKVAAHKFNIYTTLQIADMHDGYWQAVGKMLFLPPYIFLRWFFWHKGYRDGLRGIVAGIMRAWYEFLLYAKYLEAYNK